MRKFNKYQKIKPVWDCTIAGLLLVALLPVMLAISIVLLLLGKSVFFIQQRPGKEQRLFGVIKFTTMDQGKEPFTFGDFLRRTSLDELPQLINVLRGEMSFIGPRPLLQEYLQYYSDGDLRRHIVKPGITGWAQVNGRNALSLDQKLHYDVEYVDNLTLKMDVKILLLTFRQLLRFNESDFHKNYPSVLKHSIKH